MSRVRISDSAIRISQFAFAWLLLSGLVVRGAEPFREQVLPFVKSYCVQCHNDKKAEGELNLVRFTSAAMVADDFRQWEHVVTFLKNEEMPPEKAKQPSAAERAAVLQAIEAVMMSEARRLAGDPGVVLPRRLSNAEYNYAIRDLTGKDLRPTDSFPVDPASGEGFNNTGEALLMSPSLLKKYYAAAQLVSDHVLLTPSGWKFTSKPVVSFSDRKEFGEEAILEFYDWHNVNYEAYLASAWRFRYRPETQQTQTAEEWASKRLLSAKYFGSLWSLLNDKAADDKFFVGWLRERWNAIPPPENLSDPVLGEKQTKAIQALAADIQRQSNLLCAVETQAIVGNAGNGPIQHIDRRKKTAAERDTLNRGRLQPSQRFHIEFKNLTDKPTIKFVLQTSRVAAANGAAFVIVKDANFSTSAPNNYNPKNADKNFSLKALLAEHAPEQMQKLNWGQHPLGQAVEPDCLVLKVPASLEIEIPSQAFKDARNMHVFVEASLDRLHSPAGAARFAMFDHQPNVEEANELVFPLVDPDQPIAQQIAASGEAFCRLFPNRFVYVDDTRGLSAGFHLIEGFFRDDQPLCKLVLSDAERQELDRLWDELYFATQIAEKMLRGFVFFERSERNFMKHADFNSIKEEDPDLVKEENLLRFEQIYLQRSNVKGTAEEISQHPIHLFFEDIRQNLQRRTAQLKQAEPTYLQKLEAFAESAYRRPLTTDELQSLRKFFHDTSRQEEYGTEQAVRASVIRILMSPHFCYRADVAPPGKTVQPLADLALASRLSFFLWASTPDAELLSLAKAGKLGDETVLRTQTRRMLLDSRVSGFAREFFGQWLGYRDFLKAEAVSREAFPNFDDALKQAMFEEPTRFATHLIQNDLPITELLASESTFVNKRLAQHYGLPFSGSSGSANDWNLVTGLNQHGRGGLLGMAVFLTKNSQPQRTSPVKRGFWVVHKVLGEHIPAPPADVAVLPAKETDSQGKTIRELLVLHTEDVKCARCHVRFDPVGLSMEGFDPIGRTRTKDLAGRSIDNLVRLPSGDEARGVPEFARHLAKNRRDDFAKTLCRKLLGYALGRSLQLSDQSLLEKMQERLKANDDRFITLFETVVTSPQFRNQRCRDFSAAEFNPTQSGE